MAFPASFLEELKNRLSLPDVVSRRVKLQRKGREFVGLCPFHNEKTPSFNVVPDKGFYHCFGCGAHGSVFDFVMNTESLSFPEAVERLAAEAGMAVPEARPGDAERERRRTGLLDAMEAACAWFEKQLRLPDGRKALDYLHGRGLSDDTIAAFRLGYAPGGGALKGALAREGFTEDRLIEGGLLKPSDDGRDPYEYFRDRVMFPITDRQGRVIAFGGRILGDGQPKYLNSPETALFQKGRVLYGLAQARAAAQKGGEVIVAEGYMDVIALHRAGYPQAVAPLGTALTEDQIAGLWRLANEPVLCFDGDAAGRRAALRAAERALPLLKPGYSLRFALLEAGDDPDTLVTREGPDAIRRTLDAARPLADIVWEAEAESAPAETPEQRAALAERLKTRLREVRDETVRPHFEERLDRLYAQRFGLHLSGRRAWQGRGGGTRTAAPSRRVAAPLDPVALRESILLAVLINHPGLFDRVGEEMGALHFAGEAREALRRAVVSALGADGPVLDSAGLRRHLEESGLQRQTEAVLSRRVYDHAAFARPDAELSAAANGWGDILAQIRGHDLDRDLEEAQRAFEEDMTPANQRRVMELKRLKIRRDDPSYPRGPGGADAGAV